MSWVEIILV